MSKIQLSPFTFDHYKLLQKEIPDPKFLMQWAGPKYTFPLSWEQMQNKIDETDECGTKNLYMSQSANHHYFFYMGGRARWYGSESIVRRRNFGVPIPRTLHFTTVSLPILKFAHRWQETIIYILFFISVYSVCSVIKI